MIDIEEIKGFAYRMLEDRLMEILSADQQQVDGAALISAMSLGYNYGIKADKPQGEWKPKNHHTDYCSNCGFEETQWRTADYNFYPSCGARMKGADDD